MERPSGRDLTRKNRFLLTRIVAVLPNGRKSDATLICRLSARAHYTGPAGMQIRAKSRKVNQSDEIFLILFARDPQLHSISRDYLIPMQNSASN